MPRRTPRRGFGGTKQKIMNFKVGDRVVCVKPVNLLIKDKEYEVTGTSQCKCGLLISVGVSTTNGYSTLCRPCYIYHGTGVEGFFKQARFRKVEPAQRKTNSVTRQLVKDFEELKEYDPMELPAHIEPQEE